MCRGGGGRGGGSCRDVMRSRREIVVGGSNSDVRSSGVVCGIVLGRGGLMVCVVL